MIITDMRCKNRPIKIMVTHMFALCLLVGCTTKPIEFDRSTLPDSTKVAVWKISTTNYRDIPLYLGPYCKAEESVYHPSMFVAPDYSDISLNRECHEFDHHSTLLKSFVSNVQTSKKYDSLSFSVTDNSNSNKKVALAFYKKEKYSAYIYLHIDDVIKTTEVSILKGGIMGDPYIELSNFQLHIKAVMVRTIDGEELWSKSYLHDCGFIYNKPTIYIRVMDKLSTKSYANIKNKLLDCGKQAGRELALTL